MPSIVWHGTSVVSGQTSPRHHVMVRSHHYGVFTSLTGWPSRKWPCRNKCIINNNQVFDRGTYGHGAKVLTPVLGSFNMVYNTLTIRHASWSGSIWYISVCTQKLCYVFAHTKKQVACRYRSPSPVNQKSRNGPVDIDSSSSHKYSRRKSWKIMSKSQTLIWEHNRFLSSPGWLCVCTCIGMYVCIHTIHSVYIYTHEYVMYNA